jgi:DNA-binding NtrC family response regulator
MINNDNSLTILIVDDDQRMAKTLADILNLRGYKAEIAFNGPDAFAMMRQKRFDCMLTDIKMPEMNGVELYKAVKEEIPGIPVILMTAYATDDLIREGLEDGVIAAINKPLDINLLLSFFSSLRKYGSVVLVDDDHNFSQTLADILRKRGYQARQVNTSPFEVIPPESDAPDILILDVKLNGINGLDVLEDVRENYPALPVVLITAYPAEMDQIIQSAKKLNIHTVLHKPFEIDELFTTLTQVRNQQLSELFTGIGAYFQ